MRAIAATETGHKFVARAAVGALTLGTACFVSGLFKTPHDLIGDDGVAIVRNADRVDAFLLDGNPGFGRQHNAPTLGGYRILKVRRALSPLIRKRVRDVVLDRGTYDFGIRKKCIFSADVGFEITREGKSVTAIVCFSCRDMKLIVTDSNGGHQRETFVHVGSGASNLWQLAKTVWPESF